jgi:hypothetical protein
MTTLFPLFFDSGLALGRRRKKRAKEPTEPTEQKLRFSDATQTLLLVALYMAERNPYNLQTFYENMVYLKMIARSRKGLQNWLMHDSIWLPQLQALMYSPDSRLSNTFCCLLHTAMVLTRQRNPEPQNAAWFMARTLIQSERMITTNLHLHSNFHNQFSWGRIYIMIVASRRPGNMGYQSTLQNV